jgi:hypothetical protein
VARDTNGRQDVYEWERAGSSKECEEDGAELFAEGAGGCLSLISSGQSPADSYFADADPEGHDVFIRTASSLLPQDPGLIDLYDAREEGGLPPPPQRRPSCEGEACQSPSAPPTDATPASAGHEGEEEIEEAAAKRSCPRGKRLVRRAGKSRCVPKHARHNHRRAHRGHRRGASR